MDVAVDLASTTVSATPVGFALLTLPSGEERLEPVLELGPSSLQVFLRAQALGLEVGDCVPRLRLFTLGACSFDGPAVVHRAASIAHAELGAGEVVTFEVPPPDPHARTPPALDTYREPEVIADTLDNLVAMRALATIERADTHRQWTAVPARFVAAERHVALVLELVGEPALRARKGQRVTVHAEILGTRLALGTAYRGRHGGGVQLAWPKVLDVWWRRTADRVTAHDQRVEVDLVLPVVGRRVRRRASDISAAGLALELAPPDGLLVGSRLDDLVIHLGDAVAQTRGLVRNVRRRADAFLAGLEIMPRDPASGETLRRFVERQVRCDVRRAGLRDLAALWSVWGELGLFSQRHVALLPNASVLESARKTLFERGAALFVSVLGDSEGTPRATAELVRLYDKSWTLQHQGGGIDGTLSLERLLTALLEEGLRSESFEVLHSLRDPGGGDVLLDAIGRLQLAAPEVSLRRYAAFGPPADRRMPPLDGTEVRVPSSTERDWIAARAAAQTSQLEVRGLDLQPHVLDLGAITKAYHRLGLRRGRHLRLAMGVSGPLGFALIEHASAGLSFDHGADLARLYVTTADPGAQRAALVGLAGAALTLARSRNATPLLLVSEDQGDALADAGFGVFGSRVEILIERSAVGRLTGYLRLRA